MQENMVISSWMQTVLDQAQDLDVLCLMYSDVQEDIQALICWAQQGTRRYVALVVDRFFANQDLLTQPTFSFYECTDNPADVFTRVAWDSVFLRVAFVEKAKTALSEVFDECHLGVHLVASEMQDMAKKYVSNVRKNIL
ncbi:MAG: hypothetical protein FJZ57_07965, partial [Chlamydiae bacterium]|nr:hypothetical protein [Chlamydiota bacterium]